MRKFTSAYALVLMAVVMMTGLFTPLNSQAVEADESFIGAGFGLEFLSRTQATAGGLLKVQGGYNFSEFFGAGIYLGYHPFNNFNYVADLGGFVTIAPPKSGFFGRGYASAAYASGTYDATSGTLSTGTGQMGLGVGAGVGVLAPMAGSFHFAPELQYQILLLGGTALHAFGFTISMIFDL